MAYTSSGWTYTDNNSGYVDLLDNSGEITYSPISGICGGASDFCSLSSEMDYSIGLVDWTMSQTDSPKISKTVSGIPCCNQESLVCWFRNDSGVDSSFTGDNKSYSGILTDYGAKIFTRKNVDECNHVMIIGGDPASSTYSGYQFTHGDDFQYFTTGEYYDSGRPRIFENLNCLIHGDCKNKYSGTTLGHKIKYLPNTNTISGACIVDNPYLIELYFPAYAIDSEFGQFTTSAITNGAFSGNTHLSGITLSQVREIGTGAFKECTNLSYINWGNSCSGSALNTIGTSAFCMCGMEELVLPDSIGTIGDYAFFNCNSISSITFTSDFLRIGNYAFADNDQSGFTTLDISYGVFRIGSHAFDSCIYLSSCKIRNANEGIGEKAFNNCTSLRSVEIGEPASNIDANVFSGCSNLNRIKFNWANPSSKNVDQNAFNGVASNGKIVVPSDETKTLYESWKANMNGISGWDVDT